MTDNKILIHESNYLYSNIINCNNKLYKLKKTEIPKKFLIYESLQLQNRINLLIEEKKNKSKIKSM